MYNFIAIEKNFQNCSITLYKTLFGFLRLEKPDNNMNISNFTKNLSKNKKPKRLPGLNEAQQAMYNRLRSEPTLTENQEKVLKRLKNKTANAAKKQAPLAAIGTALQQGLSELGKIQESV